MELSEAEKEVYASMIQNELYLDLIKELLGDMEAENIAGKLDEIIFQFIQLASNEGYGDWLADKIWLLERLRNFFMVLTGGKMFRPVFDHKLSNI